MGLDAVYVDDDLRDVREDVSKQALEAVHLLSAPSQDRPHPLVRTQHVDLGGRPTTPIRIHQHSTIAQNIHCHFRGQILVYTAE